MINKNVEGDKKKELVEQLHPKKHFLCGKQIDDVNIIGTFSYDSKIVWKHIFRGFSNLLKNVVADDPKPSIPYVDEETSAEKEQKNRERIKEIKNLSEELNKLIKEVASITGKHMAAIELKNELSEDSNLHEEFKNIETSLI